MMAQIPLERSPRFASTSRGCLSKLPAKPDLPSAKPRQSGMWPGVAGALVSKKACRHDARFSPFRYRQMIGRMQMTSKRVMRCFRHSPYRGGTVSEFCAVLAIKEHFPSRIYKPYKVFGYRATLSLFHLDSTTHTIDHLLAQANLSPIHTNLHRKHKHFSTMSCCQSQKAEIKQTQGGCS